MARKATKTKVAKEEAVQEVKPVEQAEPIVEQTEPAKKVQEVKKVEPRFTKEQIVGASKYGNRRDLVDALLRDDRTYTKAEVDEIISKFMKGTVK